MNKTENAGALYTRLEEQQIRIRALERDIKELTSQNYDLMVRISQLCEKLRSCNSSLDKSN